MSLSTPAPIYYHGGRVGLQRGTFLLPPAITKSSSLSEFGAQGVHRMDRVYITTMLRAAVMFASGHRNGTIYQCVPDGPLEDDPDCHVPGIAFQCARARITKVIKLTPEQLAFARDVLLNDVEQP